MTTCEQCVSLRPIDIIGDSVYWLYAHLCDLTRQTARVPGCDRPDARRVCACAAGLCCGLCRTLSARPHLGRQGAPTPGRRRRPRRLVADGRQAALYSGLSEDESAANDAGFDHGAGHSLLLLYDAKTPRSENIN